MIHPELTVPEPQYLPKVYDNRVLIEEIALPHPSLTGDSIFRFFSASTDPNDTDQAALAAFLFRLTAHELCFDLRESMKRELFMFRAANGKDTSDKLVERDLSLSITTQLVEKYQQPGGLMIGKTVFAGEAYGRLNDGSAVDWEERNTGRQYRETIERCCYKVVVSAMSLPVAVSDGLGVPTLFHMVHEITVRRIRLSEVEVYAVLRRVGVPPSVIKEWENFYENES